MIFVTRLLDFLVWSLNWHQYEAFILDIYRHLTKYDLENFISNYMWEQFPSTSEWSTILLPIKLHLYYRSVCRYFGRHPIYCINLQNGIYFGHVMTILMIMIKNHNDDDDDDDITMMMMMKIMMTVIIMMIIMIMIIITIIIIIMTMTITITILIIMIIIIMMKIIITMMKIIIIMIMIIIIMIIISLNYFEFVNIFRL